MERPVTRKLLATFIEYAAKGCVTPIEWQRFIIAHYADAQMEEARRECVRILHGPQGASGATVQDLDRLRSLADGLRSAN